MDKLPYRQPEIVALGDAVALTGADSSPVRDNGHDDPPTYDDPNPPQSSRMEVDLDD